MRLSDQMKFFMHTNRNAFQDGAEVLLVLRTHFNDKSATILRNGGFNEFWMGFRSREMALEASGILTMFSIDHTVDRSQVLVRRTNLDNHAFMARYLKGEDVTPWHPPSVSKAEKAVCACDGCQYLRSIKGQKSGLDLQWEAEEREEKQAKTPITHEQKNKTMQEQLKELTLNGGQISMVGIRPWEPVYFEHRNKERKEVSCPPFPVQKDLNVHHGWAPKSLKALPGRFVVFRRSGDSVGMGQIMVLHDSGSIEVLGHGAVHKEAIVKVCPTSLDAATFARDLAYYLSSSKGTT